ncbi:hypothetical protein M9Y10_022643 [Tritrichomonas musculus]|uniref:DOCKER Lobe A domain-containing protein n=1 Tax=Tritrichomonas musculus TaxID=1915356 RepID=A0ABR2KSU6_9EUKA
MATFRPLITATPFENSESQSQISREFCELHQNWIENVIRPPTYQYQAIPIEPLPEPKVVPYNNDFNLTEEDSKVINDKRESEQIIKFLKRSKAEITLENIGIDLQPISNFVTGPREPIILFNVPRSENSDVYLKVSVENISLPDSTTPIPGVQGMLFLFDVVAKTATSDPVFFAFNDDKPTFVQTAESVCFFKIRKPVPKSTFMICVIFQDNSIDENLAGALPSTSPLPYAFSYLALCEGDVKKQFSNTWTKFVSSDSFKNIGQPPSEEDCVILNGSISAEFLEFNDLPPTCLNIDNNRNKPLLSLPASPSISDPVASFFISGIQFLFNNAPKGEYIYFKFYLCLNPTDPFKPEGTKCIASRGVDLLLDRYSSFPILSGKKVYFPDLIRVLIEKPLPTTAHFIFHIYSISHNTASLCKIAILPLFHPQDQTLIQSNLITIPVTPMKRIKSEDYLSKVKSSSKTNVIINFKFPAVLYPSKCFVDFANALIPQQVNWEVITSQSSTEVLILLAIPIVSKLLSIISPVTAEYMIDYLFRFKNFDVKNIIKSWVYSNFDPKTIRNNFTSSFTNSLAELIQSATEYKTELIPQIVYSFDLLSDILLISFPRKTENYIPNSIFNMFTQITQLIGKLLMYREKELCVSLNKEFSLTLFKFKTMCDDPQIFKSLRHHLRFLIQLNHNESFFCIFDFLQAFAVTNEFAIYIATQLPVRPLNNIMFSPFHPIASLICLALNKTMTAGDEHSLVECIKFLNQLFIPLELIDTALSFRIGYVFFPIIDIISSFYASDLMKSYHYDLMPTILFLLGYTPSQLLKNFFSSMSPNFQTLFIEFLASVTEAMISKLTPEITVLNGLFNQLTQRVIQFLFLNLNYFADCLPSVIKLISLFFSPYQIPRNFPKIFDIVSRLIKIYPCQRLLVQNLLEVMTRKQSIARCFATSLILLFFKADFDERKTVTVSSVEVIDALTSLLLHSPTEQISIYKQMIVRIQTLSPYFKNEVFTTKLNERMVAQYRIAEVIEKLRLAAHPPDERAVYVMQIANQHRTFPSMRMKWLKEIVRINVNCNNFVSAFIAQLHICALISTVFIHEDLLNTFSAQNTKGGKNNNPIKSSKKKSQTKNKGVDSDFNLIVCQPIRNARTKGGRGKYMLSEKDFSFNTGVLVETEIDFESISSDFQFISSDFTIELLKQSIEEAIEFGEKSHLYYDVRCLYSLQMRIFATERNYEELSKIAAGLSKDFHNLTATANQTHDTCLSFFIVNNKRVYCIGNTPEAEAEFRSSIPSESVIAPVTKFDPAPNEMEHLHCWKVFRGIVKLDDLEKLTNPDLKEIKLVQYTTQEELPRYTRFSEIADIKTVDISLCDHIKLETEKVRLMIHQASIEFEKCFPCRQISAIEGDYKQNIERDMNRIVALFELSLKGDDSIFHLLKLLRAKGKDDLAHDLAIKLRASIERLLKIYHRAIEYLQSPDHFLIFKEMRELSLAFTTDFKLPDANSKSYEGKRDPLTEHIEYEIS